MKKNLAMLFCLSIIIFSTGCGDASTAVDNVKENSAAKIKEAAAINEQTIQGVDKKFSLEGIIPTMTLDEVKAVLGEPVSKQDDDEYIFANGIIVEVTEIGDFVKEIKTNKAGSKTGAGISVGMTEQNLLNAYGQADSVENDDGETEYKYYSDDKTIKIEFEAKNGIISEIKTKLND